MNLQQAQYPAATLAGPYPDWREYGLLKFNVYLDGGTTLDLVVKVVDADHDETYEDRSQRVISLLPGANEYGIDLADIEEGPRDRKLDMSRIRSLQFFVDGLAAPRTIYIDHVRLVGRRTDDDPAPRWSAPGG